MGLKQFLILSTCLTLPLVDAYALRSEGISPSLQVSVAGGQTFVLRRTNTLMAANDPRLMPTVEITKFSVKGRTQSSELGRANSVSAAQARGRQEVIVQDPELIVVRKGDENPRYFFKFRAQAGRDTHGCLPTRAHHAPEFTVRVRDRDGVQLFLFDNPQAAVYYENGGGRAHCTEITHVNPFTIANRINPNIYNQLVLGSDPNTGSSSQQIQLEIGGGKLSMECRNGDNEDKRRAFARFQQQEPPQTTEQYNACIAASEGLD